MTTHQQLVKVEPEELVFRFELRKHIPTAFSMKNLTNKRLAFKVKTTNPKKYSVRPSHGFVDGNGSLEITVTLNSQKEPPTSYQNCRDKFLIQTTVVRSGVSQVTSELFDDAAKKNELQQTKLRVQMIPPAQPPSPVPEESGLGGSAMSSPSLNVPSFTPQDSHLSTPVSQQQVTQTHHGSSGNRVVGGGGFGLLHLILVTLVAFLLGYFSRGEIQTLDVLKENVVENFSKVISKLLP
jgi:hypothetical protein